jgi:hypothetical protein
VARLMPSASHGLVRESDCARGVAPAFSRRAASALACRSLQSCSSWALVRSDRADRSDVEAHAFGVGEVEGLAERGRRPILARPDLVDQVIVGQPGCAHVCPSAHMILAELRQMVHH